MNRTQYEAIHGPQIKRPCGMCKATHERQQQIRRVRHRKNKLMHDAKQRGIMSGKVIELFDRDEFTGWHRKLNRQGNVIEITGPGA